MKTITIQISDVDESIMLNDLLDIDAWFQDACRGKISSCTTRFKQEWTEKLFADPSIMSIPANDVEFVKLVLLRPDYKNRASRDDYQRSRQFSG